MFLHGCFIIYQCHTQRVSQNTIVNLTRARKGPKSRWDCTRETSKCDTAHPALPCLHRILHFKHRAAQWISGVVGTSCKRKKRDSGRGWYLLWEAGHAGQSWTIFQNFISFLLNGAGFCVQTKNVYQCHTQRVSRSTIDLNVWSVVP